MGWERWVAKNLGDLGVALEALEPKVPRVIVDWSSTESNELDFQLALLLKRPAGRRTLLVELQGTTTQKTQG